MFECKRDPKDIFIISEANISITELYTWIDSIFSQEKLDENYFKWFKEVVLDNYSKVSDKPVRRRILQKIIHTHETITAMKDILEGVKIEDRYLAITCALLHDIGRFSQALQGELNDICTFDHGDVGAQLYKEHFLDTFDNTVYNAIKEHNKYTYDGDNVYVHLTRDADKLAILRYLLCNELILSDDISPLVKQAYYEHKLVNNHDIKTSTDNFLSAISIEFDMFFDKTKQLYIESGLKDSLFTFLKDQNINL